MVLIIDSPLQHHVASAQRALNELVGVSQALKFVEEPLHFGARRIVRVCEGPQVGLAEDFRKHSTALVRRLIASAYWTTIAHGFSNDCTPDKWFLDKVVSFFRGAVPGVAADGAFMTKVLTQGSSALVHWTGSSDQTANLSAHGTIGMETCPAFVVLAHELIHADRITRGRYAPGRGNCTFLVDQRQDASTAELRAQVAQSGFTAAEVREGNVVKAGGAVLDNARGQVTSVRSGWVWLDGTMELVEEIATVGLSDDDGVVPTDPLAITENMIRAEHGVPRRLKYGAFRRPLA